MNLQIINDLSGIEKINSTLGLQENELSDERIEKIFSNLNKLLNDLEFHTKKEPYTKLTETLKLSIVEVLENIEYTVDLYKDKHLKKINDVTLKILQIQTSVADDALTIENKIPSEEIDDAVDLDKDEYLKKINNVKQKILQIQTSVAAETLISENKIPLQEIVPIAFLCDLGRNDHNGAISSDLLRTIKQGIPFITTRSMLMGTGIDSNVHDHMCNMQKAIFENKKKFEIYQKGEMFIFIPNNILQDRTSQEKLNAFDLHSDGTVKQSSVEEIFEKTPIKSSITDFISLFSEKPKASKLFYITGHGNSENVAALSKENYKIFLDFLDRQKCKGLVVSSCSSGGKSSLFHISERKSSSEASFLEQPEPHSFPVLVQSIGDFATLTNQEAESDLKDFLEEFTSFVNGPQTFKKLRQSIEKVEKRREKKLGNLNKFYPAHSAGIPGGFRPLDEQGKGFAITYNMVKKAEIGPLISSKLGHKIQPDIVVNDATLLEIHPMVIEVPIIFKKTNPLLLSMAPGNGQHYIKFLKLDLIDRSAVPLNFIKETIRYHKGLKVGNKGYFIETIKGTSTINNVALKITPDGAVCAWKEDNIYYMTKDGVNTQIISFVMYTIICQDMIKTTQPEEKALISMSGGQESSVAFQEAINRNKFFEDDFLKSKEFELNLFRKDDKEASVIYLLENGNVARSLNLLENAKLDPNFSKFDGDPLLTCAIQSNSSEMVHYLLSHGANPKAQNFAGSPPLHQIILQLGLLYKDRDAGIENSKAIEENEKIFDLLLKNSSTFIHALDEEGWPAIYYALAYPNLVEKLIAREANIDFCNENTKNRLYGHSLFSLSLARNPESIDLFIKFNANPNLGTPSPIYNPIHFSNLTLVQKLLDMKANPFKADGNETIPFIEACFYASPEVLETLLSREECDPNIISAKGMSPLLAVLITRNKEKLKMLLDKKITFPVPFPEKSKTFLEHIINLYCITDDEKSILELLKIPNAPQKLIANQLLRNFKASFLKQHIESGTIDSSAITSDDLEILTLLEKYQFPHDKDALKNIIKDGNDKLMTFLLQNKLNPNSKIITDDLREMTLFEFALMGTTPQIQIIEELLNRGAQADAIKSIYHSVKLGDPRLVRALNTHFNYWGKLDLTEAIKLAKEMGNTEIIEILSYKRKIIY